MIIDWAAANEGEWNTLGATVNSGDNTVLGFYVTEASDFTEITDIRLFNPIYEGTHKELLKTCEVYQQIAMSQLSKEELEHE